MHQEAWRWPLLVHLPPYVCVVGFLTPFPQALSTRSYGYDRIAAPFDCFFSSPAADAQVGRVANSTVTTSRPDVVFGRLIGTPAIVTSRSFLPRISTRSAAWPLGRRSRSGTFVLGL